VGTPQVSDNQGPAACAGSATFRRCVFVYVRVCMYVCAFVSIRMYTSLDVCLDISVCVTIASVYMQT
jgi:hypothetical protein